MSTFNQYLDKNLSEARRDFFEKGNVPGVIERPVINSWERCVQNGLNDRERITFDPVLRSHLSNLKESNRTLLDAADETLSRLVFFAEKANYVVTLTDQNGIALSIRGSLINQSKLMKNAFRPGVSFSESCIGTNAMGCAITERTPVSIIGSEHFYESNKHFHCIAAPIFSPNDELIGTINISREDNRPDFGALALVIESAASIEQQLFLQINAPFCIRFQFSPIHAKSQQEALLAFGNDGEIIAINRIASHLLEGLQIVDNSNFEDIFDEKFSEVLSHVKYTQAKQTLRLQSGISIFAYPLLAQKDSYKKIEQSTYKQDEYIELGDPALSKKCQQAQRVWKAGLPILITGETGSGKEVVAKYLHRTCLPKSAPFIAVNCAAIPEALIESELFGYVDGAFTGARRGGITGKIEQANQGTLFLDEIGDMPIALQTRLLRVLESGEVSPLGASKPKKVNFSLISATNQSIEKVMSVGQFRKDLFYRINGCRLKLSALRDRPEFSILINKILSKESGGDVKLSRSALDVLLSYSWPGNVRELCTTLKYALAVTEDSELIGINDLPEDILEHTFVSTRNIEEELPSNITDIRILEKSAIRLALQQTNDNVSKAAKLLGISRATLYRRLKSKTNNAC